MRPAVRSACPGRLRRPGPGAGVLAALALAALLALAVPAGALASGPPLVEATSFSAVGESAATLEAKVNPNGAETTVYHFEYVEEATFDESGFAEAKASPDGPPLPAGTEALPFSATIEGLAPGTAYRFRVLAKNANGKTKGPALAFSTLTAPQLFAPCANDALRSGALAPLGQPSALLPDCRAWEQASPVQKNGNDVYGTQEIAKAAADGGAVSFGSTFGLPGGEGAQVLPTYLASRGEGGWATGGLLPPGSAGEKAQLLGWLPDFSAAYAVATRLLSSPFTQALYELHADGAPPTPITPELAIGGDRFSPLYAYAGASADGGEVAFEALRRLPEEEGGPPIAAAREGAPNVYVRERASGRTRLASQLNSEAETQAALPKGALAGPYAWGKGFDTLRGGAAAQYYLQENHAVAADGSLYFTAAGSGQLYRRINPTQPQSALDGEGNCTEAQRACTLAVSASEKENGKSPDGTDPAGPAPAAFQAASADGQIAFFTSPEKLTDNANTGPEQALAEIGRLKAADGQPPAELEPGFHLAHALGLVLAPDGKHIYWADPGSGAIGRARIEGGKATQPEPKYLVPGATECEVEENEETLTIETPTTPRYLAVDAEHIYWTNTGPLDEFEQLPINGCGTIGRARIDPESEQPEEVEPEWIAGASNPQGIAVNSSHVYWANAASPSHPGPRGIGRAAIDGSAVEAEFFTFGSEAPYGVALDASHVYYSSDNEANDYSYVSRIPLEGGQEEHLFLGTAGIRGIALAGEDVYWATRGEEAIGRAPSELGECGTIPGCEREYQPLEGQPRGLAAAPDGHLYFSLNGEAPTNPGNDLYRYSASADPEGHHLTDLTPDPAAPDGAEVQGVLGASADGSRLYFLANGDLDGAGPASAGDCHGNGAHGEMGSLHGECSLYLWHQDPGSGEASTAFIARLDAEGGQSTGDALDWVPTPLGLFGSDGWAPKSAATSADGRTLLFRSRRQLTAYENKGVPELYRYREGEPLRCLSCNPSGAAPARAPSLGTEMVFPNLGPRKGAAAVATRFLSEDGNRAFFETTEALVGEDSDGGLDTGVDTYEWEAPGTGSCSEAAAPFIAQDGGCLYLLSPGDEGENAYFLDASASGDDAFILTRARLAGQDRDSLFDVYDARVGGGLAAQADLPAAACEAEACKGPTGEVPPAPAPASANFQGPGNPAGAKPDCPRAKRPVKRKGRWVCLPRHPKHRHSHHPHDSRRTHR